MPVKGDVMKSALIQRYEKSLENNVLKNNQFELFFFNDIYLSIISLLKPLIR